MFAILSLSDLKNTYNEQFADTLAALLNIWLTANLQAHSFIPAAYWREALPQVREEIPQAEVYFLKDGGRLGGFIGLIPQTPAQSYIAGLFIAPDYQGQGLGKRLLDKAKELYPSLTLQVYQKNSGACRFYLREGFRSVRQQTDEATNEQELKMLWP